MADFQDNFSGSAGTLLDAHTADSGETYTKITGAWGGTGKIDGAGLYFNFNTTNLCCYYSSWNPGADDYDVTGKFTSHTAANYMGFTFRGSGTDNTNVSHYELRYNAGSGLVELEKCVNGSFVGDPLQSSSTTLATGDTLTAQVRGTTTTVITVKKNSTTLFSYSDSSSPLTPSNGGKIGVFSYGGSDTSTGFSLDQLTATAATAATQVTLTGPSSSTWGSASTNYSITPNGTVASETFTPHSTNGSDTFTPSSITFTNSSAAQTFTMTAGGAVGSRTITLTSSGSTSIVYSPNPLTTDSEYPVATSFTLTAPTPNSGPVSVASNNFTVALPSNTRLTGTVTFTPHTTTTGTFSPTTVQLGTSTTSVTFTLTPGTVGAATITVTDDGGLTDPSGVTYTATNTPATALTLTPPSPASGYAGTPSSNWTVAANGSLSGSVTVTPSDAGAGGTFSPTTVGLNSGTLSGTFTYNPALSRNTPVTITLANNGGLTNPGGVSYTVNRPTFSPTPSAVQLNQSSTTVTLTGVGTLWNTNAPTFTVAGVTGVAKLSQLVVNDTSATLTLSTGGNPGTETITETNSLGTCQLAVSATQSIVIGTAPLGAAYSGLVGTITYTVYDGSGNVLVGPTASGVQELNAASASGQYQVLVTIAGGITQISHQWSTGGSFPLLVGETLNLPPSYTPLTQQDVQTVFDNSYTRPKVAKNVALPKFKFWMTTTSGTPPGNVAITSRIKKDSSSAAATANSAAFVESGNTHSMYEIDFTQSEMNADVIGLTFQRSGCADVNLTVKTQ